MINFFYEMLFPVTIFKEVKLPRYDLFTQTMELSLKFLNTYELLSLSLVNKNSNILIDKRFTEENINSIINYNLNLKISNIYQIRNYEKRKIEEVKLAKFTDLELMIDNTFHQLEILKNDLTDSIAKKCLMDYFTRADYQFLTIAQLIILGELTNDYIGKKQMGQLLKSVKEISTTTFKSALITIIFHGFMEARFHDNLENDCTFKKTFIKILFQEKYYDQIFKFVSAYAGTSREKELVEYVVIHLFLRGKINNAISFLLENFYQLDYLLIIPKLYLRDGKVDATLNFAKKVKSEQCKHDGCIVDPYLRILKEVIQHLTTQKQYQETWDVILLIDDQYDQEHQLYYTMEKCLKDDQLTLLSHMALTIQIEENKILVDKMINNFVFDEYFTKSNIYEFLNITFTQIPNTLDRLETIKMIINQYILNVKIDFAKYQNCFTNKNIIPQKLSANQVFKFLSHIYLYRNHPLLAVDCALLVRGFPSAERSECFYKIINQILKNNKSDIEKKTNLRIAIRLMGLIDHATIMKESKRSFDPIIIKYSKDFNVLYEWKNSNFEKGDYKWDEY